MAWVKALDVETENNSKPQNPYGPGSTHSKQKPVRIYITFCLALFAVSTVGKLMVPDKTSNGKWASKGNAAGGWGSEHHPSVIDTTSMTSDTDNDNDRDSSTHYHENSIQSPFDTEIATLELKEADYLIVLTPLVIVPSHSRPEYEMYQVEGDNGGHGVVSPFAEDILYDQRTAHGKAFDFVLNRDTRPTNYDDPQLIQRFVLTLLFYATGGKDYTESTLSAEGGRRGGWDPAVAHFLTGLHICHWVKKSFDDFWGILSIESDTDRRVGVTKCNADMEVTEIRLADLSLVGFIPAEIKWLSKLESFDIQNNHIAGPLPETLGELDNLNYLSLDGNNFSGTIPDIFYRLKNLERAYLNFNDFNGAAPQSLCILREKGILKDLWSDCGGYPISCTCCSVCCDMVSECSETDSQK